MGLNVGGIHVRVASGVSQESVAKRIEQFWKKIGAKVSDEDALDIKPLSLHKNGRLGFVVLPCVPSDIDDEEWIPIYDSERYHADPALARDLAMHFETDVWYWEFHDTTSQAYAKRYGASERVLRDEAVEETIEGLPGALLYYNHFKQTVPEDILAACKVLSFKEVPYRAKAKYSGPSKDQLLSNERVANAKTLAARFDAAGLAKLASHHDVFWKAIMPALESADLTDGKQLRFVYELGPVVVESERHNLAVAEAALRAGDDQLFDRSVASLKWYEAGALAGRGYLLGQAGEPQLAFRLIEAATRSGAADVYAWNNAVYFLFQTVDDPGLDDQKLREHLDGAFQAGAVNPWVFHNLACVLVSLGDNDRALEAVAAAAKYGYPKLADLETDSDLAPLRQDPRFAQALETPLKSGIDHLVIERNYGRNGAECVVRPAVGMHLFFADEQAPTAVADVFEQLRKDFPDMFAYYRPSGVSAMERTKKGKAARDVTALRKNESRYGFRFQYDDAEGQATEQRVYFEHDRDHGELSLHLPMSLADQPDELFDRLVGYAEMVPFLWGNAGYTLSPCAATYARDAIIRMAPSYLGLCFSPSQLGRVIDLNVVCPSWLTFLSKEFEEKAPKNWTQGLGEATVAELGGRGVVVRAATAPFVGVRGWASDLESLPDVVRALRPLLPTGEEQGWASEEAERLAAIAELA